MALRTDDRADADGIVAATPNQQTFKVLLIGQSRVGKTSIIRRFVKDKFTPNYKMTLGAVEWNFKCEVPIDLIEEVKTDELNRMYTMTNFLHQSTIHSIVETPPPNPLVQESIDPFDDDDKNAEFGGADFDDGYDYGNPENLNYRLSNMETTSRNDHDNNRQNKKVRENRHRQKFQKLIRHWVDYLIIKAVTLQMLIWGINQLQIMDNSQRQLWMNRI